MSMFSVIGFLSLKSLYNFVISNCSMAVKKKHWRNCKFNWKCLVVVSCIAIVSKKTKVLKLRILFTEAFTLKALMQGFRFWACCQCMSCRSCAPLHPAAVVQAGRQPLLQQQPQREDHQGCRRDEGGVARPRGGSRALSSAGRTGHDGAFICSNPFSLPHSMTAAAPLISAVRQ